MWSETHHEKEDVRVEKIYRNEKISESESNCKATIFGWRCSIVARMSKEGLPRRVEQHEETDVREKRRRTIRWSDSVKRAKEDWTN